MAVQESVLIRFERDGASNKVHVWHGVVEFVHGCDKTHFRESDRANTDALPGLPTVTCLGVI